MKIAILGWGSLVWDPRQLPHSGEWHTGGPVLPIEFSRVSKDGRLTLVVDSQDGCALPVRFSTSNRDDLHDTIADLRDREGTLRRCIGFVLADGSSNSRLEFDERADIVKVVSSWCQSRDFDAAVWTALLPQFQEQTGKPFNVANAVAYLRTLPKGSRENALDYIRKAPQEIDTPLRQALLSKRTVLGRFLRDVSRPEGA